MKLLQLARTLLFLSCTLFSLYTYGQPANDHCTNATEITLSGGGFGIGTFNGVPSDMTGATIQPGETFAPALLAAGLSQKSVWYKFSIPTTRAIRVKLAQNGTAINAGDVGFTVYRGSNCLPTNSQISSKFTPIGVFGDTYQPCVDSGVYYVQVSSKAGANGPVYVIIESGYPTASYDRPAQAYQFGTLPQGVKTISYTVECQSIEDATETCSGISSSDQYTKSSWHVFTTPAYFDYVIAQLARQNSATLDRVGFKIYEGNVTTSPYTSLPVVVSCDSFNITQTYFDRKVFKCNQLQPNKTYSIQLFFKNGFNDNIKLGMVVSGTAATQAPVPVLASIPAPSNNLGVLNANYSGVTTNATDYFGCNSRHSVTTCGPSLPAAGVKYAPNNYNYNLSSFFTFTLSSASNLNISAYNQNCGGNLYLRLFNEAPGAGCANLDTLNIINKFINNSGVISCLPAGTYTLQVMGRDTPVYANYHSYGSFSDGVYPYPPCYLTDLGSKFNLSITTTRVVTQSKFALSSTPAYDAINGGSGTMLPMVNGTTYPAKLDTFGCLNTVMPWDTACAPGNTKAIYRQMTVSDSGIISITGMGYSHFSKFYAGNASALATAQNVFTYPQEIQNLNAITKCLQYSDCEGTKVCVTPGTYTHATFGSDANIMQSSQPSYNFVVRNTTHHSPQTAENMGDLVSGLPATGGTVNSSVDYFSCKDNAMPINGYQPCSISGQPATKAIYRQFYLSTAAYVTIDDYWGGCWGYTGYMTLFSGKITDGTAGLTPMPAPWRCFQSATTGNSCDLLQPGWYTVVSYGSGPSYANPMQNVQQFGYGSYVGLPNKVRVNITFPACPGPKFNRPNKAAIDTLTNQPFLVQWGPRAGHTAAYPKTDTTYTLYRDYFNCTVDTPFNLHPLPNCNPSMVKVSYYVFRTTQESFVHINTENYYASVFAGNARNGTTGFDSSTLIQSCLQSAGYIQICKLQPGTYTLVIYAPASYTCHSVQPRIYIDQVGQSRFDFTRNAYDFGTILPDDTYRKGKVGDVNPLDPARAPSDDFFYCTTGSAPTDVSYGCVFYNPRIYNPGNNNALYVSSFPMTMSRRNLWYTFVVKEGGYVSVKVQNRTVGKVTPPSYLAVYRSNVDGTLPFSTVVSTGQVDSTAAQGLTLVADNPYFSCYPYYDSVRFYRNPCSPAPERYYVMVQLNSWEVNTQVDLSIKLDSINAIQPLFDHYSSAGNIGTNLGAGTYTGPTDNFTCATRDLTDPVYQYSNCANKTLWYRFSTNITGKVRYRVKIKNTYQFGSYYDQIQLYKSNIPGDSTSTGLVLMPYTAQPYDPTAQTYWYEQCVTPGTYYFLLPGCNRQDEFVFPELQLVEEKGDFCTAPVQSTLNGPGTSISTVSINCHTIGTDYGEFNATLTCPTGAPKGQYKTSWFRVDITGTDTLDVTTYLTENTSASSSQIKYRMMDGDCGAMQERSCVQDALTQDTYKCLAPGKSYYFQVFTPVSATGTINLNLSAVVHADTCAKNKKCLSTAVFLPQFDCTTSDSVRFTNLSTYGTGIQYLWDFGYNNQTSTAVSPVFAYPSLATAQTYTIKLKVVNTGCVNDTANVDSVSQQITMPGRPGVNLGKDTTLCTYGATLQLNATTWSGATYQWDNGSTAPTRALQSSGSQSTYWVNVSYNGCIKRDTIRVAINPINKLLQTKYLCGNDSVLLQSYRAYGETYNWSSGQTSANIYASTGGLYTNNLTWRGCNIIDTFNIITAKEPFLKKDTSICHPFQAFALNATSPGASAYTWQNGTGGATFNVTTPGTYSVRVDYPNCSKRDTVKVLSTGPAIDTTTLASVCAGSSYVLPWGPSVTTAGLYSDTIRYAAGCDSLIRKVSLNVTPLSLVNLSPAICSGQTYSLPWGQVVNTPGSYTDTVRTAAGCDSVIRTVNLSMASVTQSNSSISLCQGTSHTLPWGQVVSASGIYKDTLDYIGGCDSLIRTVQVTVLPKTTNLSSATICYGSSFTLPWGGVVSSPGTYSDTLHYLAGCDSLVTTVTLSVNTPDSSSLATAICANESFTLPWGTIVNTPGVYRDTLHYLSGCDSLIRTITVNVRPVSLSSASATICAGETYLLPWGATTGTAGNYRDTLHYASGCDSLIRSIQLTVQASATDTIQAFVCSGQGYPLPWGAVATTSGIYTDTLHYLNTGCDSLVRVVNLNVGTVTNQTQNIVLCQGQTYTLPWGLVASNPGIYRDTLQNLAGCDSLVTTVNVVVQQPQSLTNNVTLCAGTSYTLPWGGVVTTSGVYRDTLHYASGCDSLIRTVNVLVRTLSVQNNAASICSGSSYTLPWGGVVSASGLYTDTVHYADGCDSLIRSVQLSVNASSLQSSTAVICAGTTHTLPWGQVVNAGGTYRDTLHYASGCDSVFRVVQLTVQSKQTQNTTATICQGSTYLLPWGQTVSSPGQYTNTLAYQNTGCDSLTRVVNLTVRMVQDLSNSVTICSGASYLLPWGQSVSTSGTYRDTLRYAGGCDSLRRAITVSVTAPLSRLTTATICSDQNYTLPWGGTANLTGVYRDTLRSASGCDSLVQVVSLNVNPLPQVTLSKSNDVDCILGTARLTASGGNRYEWSPAGSLSNPYTYNPVASPTATTTYKVKVSSDRNCVVEDSIVVQVNRGDAGNGYYVATAFTPDGDGKNDCFGVRSWGAVTDLQFNIFNRWGEIIFSTNNPTQCWDGTYKGVPQRSEVFIYIITAKTICGPVQRKGTVTLIR